MSAEAFTTADLRGAVRRLATASAACRDELNALDGQLGDGDLGITVSAGWSEVHREGDTLTEDVGLAFLAMAKAFQRVSSSSFGTLTATGLMAAAKATKGRKSVAWSEVADLIGAGRDAMMARGKGALGDKSVLDMLDALARATSDRSDAEEISASVTVAADATLGAFRDQPNRLGRARMYAERSVGLDDPGMLAVRRLLDGLLSEADG